MYIISLITVVDLQCGDSYTNATCGSGFRGMYIYTMELNYCIESI